MPIPVPYTSNYTDHSTDAGYQFEFICEHCHNGYKSGFKTNPLGIGTKVARGFGSMFSQTLSNVGYSGGMLQDMTESQAKDKALREAIAECAPLFNQCHRCGSWVCKEICWNNEFNLCVFCAPKLDQEIGAMQSSARMSQVTDKVAAVDWTTDVNVEQKQVALCPHCRAETQPSAKFCPECGQALIVNLTCERCGAEAPAGTKFCPECGNKFA
jgi:membrane protease subunit (stomatin/prohibitin family)